MRNKVALLTLLLVFPTIAQDDLSIPGVPKPSCCVSCWSGFTRLFTRQHLLDLDHALDTTAKITETALDVAAILTAQPGLASIAANIAADVAVIDKAVSSLTS